MTLKKMIFINSIGTFLLCFLTHFLYKWLPNPVFAIMFPVNESVWEHMKMIYTTILLFGILEYFIIKKFKLNSNNFIMALVSKAILCIPIFLIIYYPLLMIFGENMIITFIILFISIMISNIIGYKIINMPYMKNQKEICIGIIVVCYFIFGILTYKVPHLEIFYDKKEEKYGIS